MANIIKKSPAKLFYDRYFAEGILQLEAACLRFKGGVVKDRGIEDIVMPLNQIKSARAGRMANSRLFSSLIITLKDGTEYVFVPRAIYQLIFTVNSRSWAKLLNKYI